MMHEGSQSCETPVLILKEEEMESFAYKTLGALVGFVMGACVGGSAIVASLFVGSAFGWGIGQEQAETWFNASATLFGVIGALYLIFQEY